ncbi:MAG: hypothetical protein HYX79_08155 [Chloroflexi bacterium]|nr:hypothetical protein [Chloroflexota bacterium]
MTENFGLPGIWESLNAYLKVDVSVSENELPNRDNPVLIRFVVTNSAQNSEDQPEILFEEVRLRVGISPDWHVEKLTNLAGGQSFSYEHRCTYSELSKIQWNIEGRVSPATLLQFRRRPDVVPRNHQLSVGAYVGFLGEMNIHQWLKGTLKSLAAPGPDTTLAEMKAKEDSLSKSIGEISAAVQRLQDISLFIRANNREEFVRHMHLAQEYLQRTIQGYGELSRSLETRRAEHFSRIREDIVSKLTTQAEQLDKATAALANKFGGKTANQ